MRGVDEGLVRHHAQEVSNIDQLYISHIDTHDVELLEINLLHDAVVRAQQFGTIEHIVMLGAADDPRIASACNCEQTGIESVIVLLFPLSLLHYYIVFLLDVVALVIKIRPEYVLHIVEGIRRLCPSIVSACT